MKGSYHVRVSNRYLSYEFTLRRNFTIVKGDSATGKTTLVEMIREYETQGSDSAINLSCEKACVVIEGNTWKRQLRELDEDSIIFIDEGSRFVASKEFADVALGSGHYYVIVTREVLYMIPYSVAEIYGIHSSGKYNSLQPVYHEFYRLYAEKEPEKDDNKKIDTVVTEDSNSGYQFFSGIIRNNVLCISAGGNSNLFHVIREKAQEKHGILIIADGAAFGAYMPQISTWMKRHDNVIFLYLPESFEWLILKSGLIDGNYVSDILKSPEDSIESLEYASWEQFFTDLLIKETNGTYLQYQKTKLNTNYLRKRERDAVLNVLPQRIKEIFDKKE